METTEGKKRYPLDLAELVGQSVVKWLAGACEKIEIAGSIRRRETNGDGSWLETFTLQSENLPKMYWVDGVRPRHAKTRHTTPPSVISSSVRYTYQVGTCDTLDCDNVTWSSRTASVRAAEDPNS